MDCPKCKSENKIRNGFIQKIQRYKCKDCGYNFTVEKRSNEYSLSVKKNALQLYLEGLGFRSIGRILKVSNVTVLNWIRAFGKEVEALQNESAEIEVVEVDEMHSYIGSKKTTAGFGLLLIDLGRNSSTSLLATEAMQLQKNSGKASNSTK